MTITQSAVMTAVREDRLGDSSTSQWTDANLRRWINDGAKDMARRTEYLQDREDIAAVIGTQEYTLPATTLRVYRLEWTPDNGPTTALDYRDFNNMDAVWWTSQRTAEGTPVMYTMWGFPPSLKLVVYPTPSEDGDFKVFYYRTPAELATTTTADANTVLEIPSGWEDLLVDYVEYMALRKDRDPRWQEAKQKYEDRIGDLYDMTRRYTDQAGGFVTDTGVLPSWLVGGDY